jgi:hypothetical protein
VYTLKPEKESYPMNLSMPLQGALLHLLAERKLLRQLSNDLTRFHLMENREQVQQTEQRISDLVTGPLHLSKYESITPWILAEAVQSLLSYLGSRVYCDEPATVWNRQECLTPGTGVSWARPLQERLTALCGQLDTTVSKMLEGSVES